MKDHHLSPIRVLLLLTAMMFASAASRAAISFTITPSTVDSAYAGFITLQVGPVTPGSTVLFQKFADLNGSGVLTSTDPMIHSFEVTDNQAFVIGGVTNTSVPGDANPTSGTITVQLNAFNNGLVPNTSGKFIYKVSNVTGSTFSTTASLTVNNTTNAGYGTITGTVKASGSPVANCPVVVATPLVNNSGFTSAGGTYANSSGVYTIKVVPGTYVVAGLKSNYVANVSTAPSVTVTAGATVTNNPTLVAATQSISGQMYDTNSKAGIAGFLTSAVTTNGNFAVGFTDPNGNYTLRVINGTWRIEGNERWLGMMGYLSLDGSIRPQVTVSGANVTGVNVGFPKESAMIYGRVLDNFGNPVAGVDFGSSGNTEYESEAVTDINGYYYLGANADASGNWSPYLNTPLIPALEYYDLTQSYNGTNLSTGQAIREDFGAVAAPYTITGSVLNVSNTPIVGVQVYAGTTINGTNYSPVNGTTDSNGMYVLYVAANSTWYVSVDCQYNNNNLGDQGYGCVDTETVIIGTKNGVANFVAPGVGYAELDGSLTDNYGNPIAGVQVNAVSENSYPSQSTTTDANGFYEFLVEDGYWDVSVNCTNLTAMGFNCPSPLNGIGAGVVNSPGNNFTAQSSYGAFFTGEISLGSEWFYLHTGATYGFGYYNMTYYPYIFHLDMGWFYFIDAADGANGAYFYDFTSGAWVYTNPAVFPNLYDFHLGTWVFYDNQAGQVDYYTTNPRQFYNYTSQTTITNL